MVYGYQHKAMINDEQLANDTRDFFFLIPYTKEAETSPSSDTLTVPKSPCLHCLSLVHLLLGSRKAAQVRAEIESRTWRRPDCTHASETRQAHMESLDTRAYRAPFQQTLIQLIVVSHCQFPKG